MVTCGVQGDTRDVWGYPEGGGHLGTRGVQGDTRGTWGHSRRDTHGDTRDTQDTGDTQGTDTHVAMQGCVGTRWAQGHGGLRDTVGTGDTAGTGAQQARGHLGTHSDTEGTARSGPRRAVPGHARRSSTRVPRTSPRRGGGSPGVLWLRQRVQGAGLLFHSPQFHQGALSTDRGGSGATRGPRRGGHGERGPRRGLRRAPHGGPQCSAPRSIPGPTLRDSDVSPDCQRGKGTHRGPQGRG